MIDVLRSVGPRSITRFILEKAIEGANTDTFKHLLGYSETSHPISITFLVVASGSEPLMEVCKPSFDTETFAMNRPTGVWDFMMRIIKATEGDPDKESCLISLWEKLHSDGIFTKDKLGVGFLARYLIDLGADVNYVPAHCSTAPTPFRYAARRNSAAAANLIRFLLLQGANPDLTPIKPKMVYPKIEDEKGPRGIAKWLGVSWDELLVQTKEEREKGLRDGSIRA
ncbi:hypothetical protein LTS15_007992 [Exophiala xenobiotica]|nr:hypothetical protein LTS15_007992 [Exophiala xenobiotica]